MMEMDVPQQVLLRHILDALTGLSLLSVTNVGMGLCSSVLKIAMTEILSKGMDALIV